MLSQISQTAKNQGTVGWVLLYELSIKTIHHRPIWPGQSFNCPFSALGCVSNWQLKPTRTASYPLFFFYYNLSSNHFRRRCDSPRSNTSPQSWVTDTLISQSASCGKISELWCRWLPLPSRGAHMMTAQSHLCLHRRRSFHSFPTFRSQILARKKLSVWVAKDKDLLQKGRNTCFSRHMFHFSFNPIYIAI